MKRILCALSLVFITSLVYAQITFSGSVHTGVVTYFPNGSDATISVWSPYEGTTAALYLDGSFTNPNETFGFDFTLGGNTPLNHSTSGTSALPYYTSARGWIKFWDKKMTIIAGMLDDTGVFRTFGGIDEQTFAAEHLGMHVRFEDLPFAPNLMLGASILPGYAGVLNLSQLSENTMGMGMYRFAARYSIPDTLNILAMFYNDSQTQWYRHNRLHAFLAFDVHALREVGFATLQADFAAYDMQDSDYINMKFGQSFAFRAGPMEIGGRFRQSIIIGNMNGLLPGYAPELLFKGHWAMLLAGGRVRPRIEAAYLYGGFDGNPAIGPSLRSDGYNAMEAHLSSVHPGRQIYLDRVQGFRQDAAFFSMVPQIEIRVLPRWPTAITIGGGPLFNMSTGRENYSGFLFVNLRVEY